MATVELTSENFESVVTGNDIVVVDFWAPWCGPCRQFAPTYEKASEKHEGVVFAKVNTEDQPQLAGEFGIRAIPTMILFKGGQVADTYVGLVDKATLRAKVAVKL